MADAAARKAAIKKASQQVRAGGVFGRASSMSKVAPAKVLTVKPGARPHAQKRG